MLDQRGYALLALVIALLCGCVATPTKDRPPVGDFVMNIGSADRVLTAPKQPT
jgi:hypothetical protein